ncbi:regulator of G-protein signaling 5 isoform X1 [Tachysurus vachellii]|uniref:regulator of G-protein signaling 5 isoform X1 n=2 Tax=Tachysurus vachellii TaxID=175792 RepID=UPI00296AE214|nr:regulator of G-protein signaling 5 isoform X1 [Tachysurus vachellii]
MCKGLSALPSSCLEKAKEMKVKLTHLAEKPHKHRANEEKTPPDLESLLQSKAGLQVFRWFLRSEFSEENLDFWLACEEYKTMPETKLSSKAQIIYTQFIAAEAPQEVNLDCETREVLMDRMDTPATDTFVEAQQRIFTLMAKDSFPRFLHSSYYKQTVRGA